MDIRIDIGVDIETSEYPRTGTDPMNWTDMQTFLAVAQHRSFSRAAESLHLTQPAISKRIQRLEDDVGISLFDRVGKQIYLTAAGSLLQPRAESLLAELADTRRLLHNLKLEVSGVLALTTSHHVGLHRLSPVLKAFTEAYPQVRLDIRFEDSEAAHDIVRNARSEMAVVTLDPHYADATGRGLDAGLDYLPLWNDPLCFVAAASHPLARPVDQDTPTTLAMLAEQPVILPGLATYTGRIVVELFTNAGLRLTPSMSTNYLETISMLVGSGLGWSVLPASMVGPELVTLATNAPPLQRMLGCVTHPQRTLSNAADAFRAVLTSFRDPGLTHAQDSEHDDA
jgi:DNA-binding transcriptional LysR family regulator